MARQLFHQAAADDPSSVVPWLEMAAIAGSPEESRQCLTEVLNRDPNHAGARQCLAHLETQRIAMSPIQASAPAARTRRRVRSANDELIPVEFDVPSDFDEPPARPSPLPPDRRARVMIIDDTQAVRDLIRRHIEEMGLRAIEASGAKEAIAKLHVEGVPELILLDGIMPGINGFELCNQLRQKEETARVPIVLLAFENGWLPSLRSMMSGFNDTLAKPIAPLALRAMVAKYCPRNAEKLGKASSRRELPEEVLR
jgi:CheY-like chemotaxis protein